MYKHQSLLAQNAAFNVCSLVYILLNALCKFIPGLNYVFQEMSQRLYIGGLFHGVSEAEVKERFGKFGSISNMSIKTKHDISGNNNNSSNTNNKNK